MPPATCDQLVVAHSGEPRDLLTVRASQWFARVAASRRRLANQPDFMRLELPLFHDAAKSRLTATGPSQTDLPPWTLSDTTLRPRVNSRDRDFSGVKPICNYCLRNVSNRQAFLSTFFPTGNYLSQSP